jgi:hypothetical protein
MANKLRYTVQDFLKAIEGSYGIKTIIARKLGCNRMTVENYIKRFPTIAKAVKQEREILKDLAEGRLVKAIQDGEPWAVKYVLSTLAKDRGYVERQEIAGTQDQPLKVQIEYVNDWRTSGENSPSLPS